MLSSGYHRGKRGRGGRGQASKMIGPTNKEALEKLSETHPLPALILQWRKINSSLTKVRKEQLLTGILNSSLNSSEHTI